jgi:hypothetical protein
MRDCLGYFLPKIDYDTATPELRECFIRQRDFLDYPPPFEDVHADETGQPFEDADVD